ncbi:MAG: electron transfer flavoprotein subunit alpha/FixB family protein [Lachnospiraceae bacterium]
MIKSEDGSGIMVYLELCESGVSKVSRELIAKAYSLCRSNQEKLYLLYVGEREETATLTFDVPVDELWIYQIKGEFQEDIWDEACADCISNCQPAILLISGTNIGRAIASRLAVVFRTGVTADCTDLILDEKGHLVQTRPAFGGNIMASILTERSRPQIATVRAGIFPTDVKSESYTANKVEQNTWVNNNLKSKLIWVEEKVKSKGIEGASIVIVAGRGIKRKEDLAMLAELADLMDGVLASSRALVEMGWMDAVTQIGLSGNTVAPEYLLTFGVSGTVQFMAGMQHARTIIAVNTDRDANIFRIAHIPICADLYDVVPEMLQKLKNHKREKL